MKILYYSFSEITRFDVMNKLRERGYEVEEVISPDGHVDMDCDKQIMKDLMRRLDEENIELIFSCYFVPVIAKAALLKKTRYVVWLFDALPLTAYSQMIYSPYNYIFTFDRVDRDTLLNKGVKNVWHLPLAVNKERVEDELKKDPIDLTLGNDVAFIGTLYDDEFNYYDQIPCMLEETKGYVDGIIAAQLQLYGYDILSELVDDELVKKLERTAKVSISPEYTYTDRDIFIQMIQKKATVKERKEILSLLSDHFKVSVYTGSDTSQYPKMWNRGRVDYYTDMLHVFQESKININISLRRITSGMSLRLLDVMSAGGFLLSNYQPELAEFFEDGKDMVMFESREDMLKKVQYYLNHEDERKKIAKNGQIKVMKEYTYENQLSKIFTILESQGYENN